MSFSNLLTTRVRSCTFLLSAFFESTSAITSTEHINQNLYDQGQHFILMGLFLG